MQAQFNIDFMWGRGITPVKDADAAQSCGSVALPRQNLMILCQIVLFWAIKSLILDFFNVVDDEHSN